MKSLPSYSMERIEDIAEDTIMAYDSSYLYEPKPLDVYHLGEYGLGLSFEFKYIDPDMEILGLATFSDGLVPVSPAPYWTDDIKPEFIELDAGTVLIDARLLEARQRNRERFTAAHEIGHQILHTEYFMRADTEMVWPSRGEDICRTSNISSPIQCIESQANRFAAALLMPRIAITDWIQTYCKKQGTISRYLDNEPFFDAMVRELAGRLQVSVEALLIRLRSLGFIKPSRYRENS